jgi:hypothetical protein
MSGVEAELDQGGPIPAVEAAPVEEVIDLSDESVGKIVISGGADLTLKEGSPIGITAPLVEPVSDAADLGLGRVPAGELAALDESDSARAAAIRRQEMWNEDSKAIFKGPTEDQIKLESHLRQLDEMDGVHRREREMSDAGKRAADELANADKMLADLRVEYDNLKQRATVVKSDIERLEALKGAKP